MPSLPEQMLAAAGNLITGEADFRLIFNHLPIGVLATDAEGFITYYNPCQAKIDSLDESYAVGRHVTKVYGPDPGPSMVMTCLESGRPITDYVGVYRTAYGKMVNSSHYVFPLFQNGRVSGCLCFIQSLSTLEVSAPTVSTITDLGQVKKKPVSFDRIVGRNLELQKAVATASLAARSPSPIMLYGETGTGKEMFASSIHQASSRGDQPFVVINCSAIPETLLEGILFGTTKGSFTGAVEKKGLLEEANGGTIFLDEIDSMPLTLQPKLLRALQERKVRRIGSGTETELDIKIISAMSVSPLKAVEHGKLRSDLFYRLGVVLVNLPPLRRRIDDLEELLTFFILKYNTILGKKVVHFSHEAIKFFRGYDWPGNVRELEHLVEGALNLVRNQTEVGFDLMPDYFQEKLMPAKNAAARDAAAGPGAGRRPAFEEPKADQEVQQIAEALKTAFGNTTLAAKILGTSRQLLSYRMKKFNINKNDFKLPD